MAEEKDKKKNSSIPTLSTLRPPRGSRRKHVRVGRGMGSKLGKNAGKGNKGQQSRRAYSHRCVFEGGQMPLHRRIPKRGFANGLRRVVAIMKIDSLIRYESG